MRSRGTGWLWTTAVILVGAVVCLTPDQVRADWVYEYQDDFSNNDAEADSYLHSIFWPQGAFPPPEAYLYYLDTGSQRELGLGDYHGQPAYLGYRFGVDPLQSRAGVRGNLQVDVRFPYQGDVISSLSGYLLYSFSADGVNWLTPQELGPGGHDIWIESVRGTCYVIFYGTEVLIDNIHVRLYSSPATIRVPQNFATIQQAVDSAADGDIVEVAPGTYGGDGNRDIDFRGKAITVRSSAGPEQTIIDCSGRGHRGFYFHRGEGLDSVVRGFKIVGALVPGSEIPSDYASWSAGPANPVGGGIYCEFTSPTIIGCVIKDCKTELGGGIGVVGGAPSIIDCVIEECRAGGLGIADSGGYGAGIGLIRGSNAEMINCAVKENVGYYNGCGAGVYCRQSSALLANCNISFNIAQGNIQGGGIYCEGLSASVVLENCIISNNAADVGGGVFANSFDYVRLTNCTVADNQLSGTQMASSTGGGIHSVDGEIAIRNSIVWFNDGMAVSLLGLGSNNPVLYSNIEGYYPGQGNIDADPLFSSMAGDYHVRSVGGRYDPYSDRWIAEYYADYHSPCIDAGDPQDSVGPEPFPNRQRINMGAYGGTRQASKSTGPLIFHVDCAHGSNYNTGLSRTNAFATIQKAVDTTIDGDTVMVWPGEYREEVTFNRKAITLQSADEAAVVVAPGGYAFSFYGAESSMSVLRNFVITNCSEAAVFCNGAEPDLINLTIANNQFGIVAYGGASPDITNCILWNNGNGDLFQCHARYSCVEQSDAANGDSSNIRTDPLFTDPVNGDYHLQSKYGRYSPADHAWLNDPLTSACVDSGDPSVYPGRERMPHGGRVNMGAYGGTPFASLSGWPSWGEANHDDQLDTTDRTIQVGN